MEFKVSDVTAITGVKRLRLHSWMKLSYILPSVQSGEGSGNPNIFDRFDLYQIELFKYLTEKGFSRDLAAEYKVNFRDLIKDEGYSSSAYQHLVFCQRDGKFQKPFVLFEHEVMTEHLLGEIQRADDVYMVNLRKLRDRVNSKILELSQVQV